MLKPGDRVRVMHSAFPYATEGVIKRLIPEEECGSAGPWYKLAVDSGQLVGVREWELELISRAEFNPTRSSTTRRLKAWKERGGVL